MFVAFAPCSGKERGVNPERKLLPGSVVVAEVEVPSLIKGCEQRGPCENRHCSLISARGNKGGDMSPLSCRSIVLRKGCGSARDFTAFARTGTGDSFPSRSVR